MEAQGSKEAFHVDQEGFKLCTYCDAKRFDNNKLERVYNAKVEHLLRRVLLDPFRHLNVFDPTCGASYDVSRKAYNQMAMGCCLCDEISEEE